MKPQVPFGCDLKSQFVEAITKHIDAGIGTTKTHYNGNSDKFWGDWLIMFHQPTFPELADKFHNYKPS